MLDATPPRPVSPRCLVRAYARDVVAEHGPRPLFLDGYLPFSVAGQVLDLLGLDMGEDLPGEEELSALLEVELARVPS